MRKFFIISGFCLSLLAGMQSAAQAVQDTTQLYKIETKDGNDFFGWIMSKDTTQIDFRTEDYGNIVIRIGNVKAIEAITPDKVKEGKIWLENFQDTRYFFSPNGYGLRKGEAYYQNVWVLYNQVSVGITKNISIGGGMVPLFLFAGAPTPMWIIPKVSFPIVKDKLNVGAGALLGYVVGEENAGFGILYGTGTLGSRDKNVTFGLGYGFAAGEWLEKPIINVCVLLRAGPKSYFMSENYYLNIDGDNIVLISAGGRSVIKRMGLDYGLFIPFFPDQESFVAIPWLGLTVPLGKQKNKELEIRN
jgi:hypothetical protein